MDGIIDYRPKLRTAVNVLKPHRLMHWHRFKDFLNFLESVANQISMTNMQGIGRLLLI